MDSNLHDMYVQAITPIMKRTYPNETIDAMNFFESRVKTNLHIIVCLPPDHKLLAIAAR